MGLKFLNVSGNGNASIMLAIHSEKQAEELKARLPEQAEEISKLFSSQPQQNQSVELIEK
ncbi:hypothetical protein K8R66_01420 [bacterium]|nr:hypothetical protein [bacterium]